MRIYIALIILLSCLTNSFATSWDNPKIRHHYSTNKHYRLTVIPAGHLKKYDKPVAVLISMLPTQKTKKIWEILLENKIEPMIVLISDNGEYVVTIGGSANSDIEAFVVIYGSHGKVIKKFTPISLLGEKYLNQVRKEVKAICFFPCWKHKHKISKNSKSLIFQFPIPPAFNKYSTKEIELNTGKILNE